MTLITTADLLVDSEQFGRAHLLWCGVTQRVVAKRLQGAADVEPLVDDLTRGDTLINAVLLGGATLESLSAGVGRSTIIEATTYSRQEEDHAAQREAACVTKIP